MAAAAATAYVSCRDGAFPPSHSLTSRPPAPAAASSSGTPRDRWAYLCALRAAVAAAAAHARRSTRVRCAVNRGGGGGYTTPDDGPPSAAGDQCDQSPHHYRIFSAILGRARRTRHFFSLLFFVFFQISFFLYLPCRRASRLAFVFLSIVSSFSSRSPYTQHIHIHM